MHAPSPEEPRLETLERRIYALFNTDDELQNYVRSLDNRWAIARRLAKGLLDGEAMPAPSTVKPAR
jgi:hypothetical protein